MILRCDVALLGLVIEDRLVLTTVAKRKLLGCTTGGKAHQLVSHTDTINWLDLIIGAGNDLFEFLDSSSAHGRISRSVTQEETVVLVHFGGERIIPGYHRQLDTTLDEKTDNIVLHTTIDCNHLDRVSLSVDLRFLDADFADQVSVVGILHLGEVRWRRVEIDFDSSQQEHPFHESSW